MSLQKITLAGYRCFDTSTELELRPLTIVLGRNNSGKSALVRAPMLLEKAILTDSPEPIDLDEIDDEIVESFTDLIYGHQSHGDISLSLEMANRQAEPVSIKASIQHLAEYDRQVVSALEIKYRGNHFTARWTGDNPGHSGRFSFRTELNGEFIEEAPLRFNGIIPAKITEYSWSRGKKERASIMNITDGYPRIRYLGPFRERPDRRFRSPSRMPRTLGIRGENAGKILAVDYVRRDGQLLAEVNALLAKDLPGWAVDLVQQGGIYEIVLKSTEESAIRVNLADTGTGVAQVFPVFVQRAMDRLRPLGRPVLEITEQPELHLHPAAHGGIADLYLTAARKGNIQFLIETHSETFLLRVRRRIAEGIIDSDSVALYFVENERGHATSRRINIAPDGSLDYWPDGVFSEDYEEARALASAQLNQGEQDAR